MKNIFRNKKGLSLIEMMVAVVILGLIILALVTFFTGGTKSWMAGQSQLKAQREARQAIDRMVREIREASDIKDSSTSSEINFNTPWSTNLKYSWLGNKWDPILEGTNPLINNVQSLTFTYFDNSGNSVVPESASKVHIDLKVDVDKDDNPDITLNTDVNLRNYDL
jgi:prepilin-type N-terminal cleavage/methylation domain-containing protein